MRRGAFDFIPKPFTPEQIRQVLQKIVRTRSLEQRVRQLESQLADESPEIDLTSLEPAVQRVLEMAFKAADTTATILILGPSGTGKNVLAREIHRRSAQRERPFVTVNCPSLSKELLESELFGHVKGAFTGAVQDTFGKVAAAEGGTLFLDEIGEMPLEIQPKLLRLLQDREYERVGEARPRQAGVRVIAASNRNLAEEMKAGRFREDLFYRLNVITVALPGLHERPADLLRLAGNYLVFFAPPPRQKSAGVRPRRHGGVPRLPLAGQPAGTAQRDRARRHPRRWRHPHDWPICRRNSPTGLIHRFRWARASRSTNWRPSTSGAFLPPRPPSRRPPARWASTRPPFTASGRNSDCCESAYPGVSVHRG